MDNNADSLTEGYLTSTTSSKDLYYVYGVYYTGSLNSTYGLISTDACGIRPVITIDRSVLN